MPPTDESTILTTYLLQPAPLTAITTLDQFRALFPPSAPPAALRSLFRDLQAQRAAITHDVARSITAEAARGAAMRREVVRVGRAQDSGEVDGEVEMERAVRSQQKLVLFQASLTVCIAVWRQIRRQDCQTYHQLHRPGTRRRGWCSRSRDCKARGGRSGADRVHQADRGRAQ